MTILMQGTKVVSTEPTEDGAVPLKSLSVGEGFRSRGGYHGIVISTTERDILCVEEASFDGKTLETECRPAEDLVFREPRVKLTLTVPRRPE